MQEDLLVRVSSSGVVKYVPSFRFTSLCVTSQDSPECPLTFGTWILNTDQLHLSTSSMPTDDSFYVQHPEYELDTIDAEVNSRAYACYPGEKYGEIRYTIRLRLRS